MAIRADVIMVIPCYNEAARLDKAGLASAIEKTNINFLFVNDGSKDGGATKEMLKDLKRQFGDRVDFATLNPNRGKSEAVRYGYKLALETNPRQVGFMDADGAVPLFHADQFVRQFGHSKDIRAVIGVRTKLAGHKVERNSAKFLSQKIIVMLARQLGVPVTTDTQCGAKLFDARQAAKAVDEPFISKRWLGCDLEFLARLARLPENKTNKNWLFEYPVPIWKDIGNSTRPASSYIGALKDYMKIFIRMKRG